MPNIKLKLFAVAIAIIVLSALSHAQGGAIGRQVLQPPPPNGNGGLAPGASILVCTFGSLGTPCNSPITLYADPTLNPLNILFNPLTADQNGWWMAFVPEGNYLVQETPIIGGSVIYSYDVFSNGQASVSSVGLSLPSIFNVSGSPVTGSGTLTGTFALQPPNMVFASPVSGTGIPVFRNSVAGDFGSGIAPNTVLGNCTNSTTSPLFCPITANMIPSTLGNLSLTGNLSVAGTTTLSNSLSVTGTVAATGSVNATGAVSGSALMGASVNSNIGYQIGGSYGTNGYCLVSTGSGTIFSPICSPSSLGGTPTFVANSGAGTSPTITLGSGSTDRGGLINLTMGTSVPSGQSSLLHLIFSINYPNGQFCTLTPANLLTPQFTPDIFVATTSAVMFLNTTVALSSGSTYSWYYLCELY